MKIEIAARFIQKPSDLILYHGTTGIYGDNIKVRSNTGVGYNDHNLGNGFYTTISKDASGLFAHLAHMNRRLRGEENKRDQIKPKIYLIT